MATKKTPARSVPKNDTFEKLARRSSAMNLSSIVGQDSQVAETAPDHTVEEPKESQQAATPDAAPPVTEVPEQLSPAELASPNQAIPVSAGEPNEMVPVQFFFTTELMQEFKSYTQSSGLSQPMVILQAVQTAYPHLRELLGASTVSLAPNNGDEPLFDLPATVTIKNDQDGPKNASTTVKMRRSNLQRLDTIYPAVGAPSRNHMVFVSLKYFLHNTY